MNKDKGTGISRREVLWAGGAGLGVLATGGAYGKTSPVGEAGLENRDPIETELVMDLVVTCSSPERMGLSDHSKDGIRDEIWPIVGGYFRGPDIRGQVIPGGADYPVTRPDGMVIIDALYRLQTNDGVNILIHNKGFYYPDEEKARLVPVFTAPTGHYDWLNKSIFLSTLTDVPKGMGVAEGPNENDRLIQVHRVRY